MWREVDLIDVMTESGTKDPSKYAQSSTWSNNFNSFLVGNSSDDLYTPSKGQCSITGKIRV